MIGVIYRFSFPSWYDIRLDSRSNPVLLFTCFGIKGKLKLTQSYNSKGTPIYCAAKQVEDYLEAYASHFNLGPHFRLSTTVRLIARDGEGEGRWRLDFEGRPSEWFDKVVVATGPHKTPVMPDFEGADLFTGRLIHSKSFKKYAECFQ